MSRWGILYLKSEGNQPKQRREKMTKQEIKQAAKDISWMISNTINDIYRATQVWEIENNASMTEAETNEVFQELEYLAEASK